MKKQNKGSRHVAKPVGTRLDTRGMQYSKNIAVNKEGHVVVEPRRKSNTYVKNSDFVRAWMACKSKEEVAAKFGMAVGSVSSKASTLRKKGVNLPMFLDIHNPESVEELNKLIDKLKKDKS